MADRRAWLRWRVDCSDGGDATRRRRPARRRPARRSTSAYPQPGFRLRNWRGIPRAVFIEPRAATSTRSSSWSRARSRTKPTSRKVTGQRFGTDAATGQPILTSDWIDRLVPRAWAVIAVGTCATYGGIHAMEGNPTGAMGLIDYLGPTWKSKAEVPLVCVPGCPTQPDNLTETLLYLTRQLVGRAPMIPLDSVLRPRGCSSRRCTRAAIVAAITNRPTSPSTTDRRSASSNLVAGARSFSATSANAAGWAASAAAPTSAASASAAPCRASPTSSNRSWISHRARCCRPRLS